MNPVSWVSDLFPNAYHVARREFDVRVRTRAFMILTALLALVGLGLTLVPLGVRLIGPEKPVSLAVFTDHVDAAVPAAATLQATLNATSSGGSGAPKYRVTEVTDLQAARAEVRADKLGGLLVLHRETSGEIGFEYFSKDSGTSQSLALVRNAANDLSDTDQLLKAGVSPTDLGRIYAPAPFTATAADPQAARRQGDEFIPSYVLATVFVVLMFMAIQIYGNWVATSVGEEKSSRVMELLITAATPRQLLLGKVLGTGAAGLTQYVAVLLAALAGFVIQGLLAQALLNEPGFSVPGLAPAVLLGFGVYFVTGFVLYSVLYAAAGSMVSRQEDVQQVVAPLTFVGLGGYLLSFVALSLIDAPWVKILSYVPFVSPFLFPARIVLGEVAPWEYLLSVVLMLLAILGALWVAARIYQAGVLLYGQRPSMRKVLRTTIVGR